MNSHLRTISVTVLLAALLALAPLQQCYEFALAQLAPPADAAQAGSAGGNAAAADASAPAAPIATPIAAPAVAPALTLPLIGALDVQSLSLPVFTLVVAGLDAFNPCVLVWADRHWLHPVHRQVRR